MSTLNFPISPTVGQTYNFGQYRYRWDGQKWFTIGVGYNPVNDLKDELASSTGYSMLGTSSGATLKQIIDSNVTLPELGIFENSIDNSVAISSIKNNVTALGPIDSKLRKIKSSSFEDLNYLLGAQVEIGTIIRVPGVYPEMLGGRYSFSNGNGSQLSLLNQAINDPKYQKFGITFIGDSITWGTGSSGSIASGPTRDGTLSDYRNNSSSCSYVNEVGRLIKEMLGPNVTEVLSNHPFAVGTGGESIRTFKKDQYCFPKGDEYTFAKTGVASSTIVEQLVGPFLGAQRRITVNNGAMAYLSFKMTGDSFTLIFGGLLNGASYEVLVNNRSIGSFSSRVGDDGILALNNQRRKHTFPYVKDANVTLLVKQYGSELVNNSVYIEGLLFEREIQISNQGIIGATTGSYRTYNFPTNVSSGLIKRAITMSNFTETSVGTVSFFLAQAPESSTGEQRRYGYISGSHWELQFSIPSGNDRLLIGYSSLPNTGAIEVYADNVLIETIHTSDMYPGNTTGYSKSSEVVIPLTTTSIKLKTVYEVLGGGSTCYIYLEGVGYRNSTDVSYPINNGFGDGVCLNAEDCFAFFQLGTNDRGGNRVKSQDEITANIETMLTLLPQGCKPILMATPPAETTSQHNFSTTQVRNAVVKVSRSLGIDLVDNHELFGKCPIHYFTTDNLHPNDLGHTLIAKNIIFAITNAKL